MIKNRLKILLITFLFSISSCNKNDKDIGKQDAYIVTEQNLSSNCSIYQMLIKSKNYKKGDWFLRVALSGQCKNLTKQEYIEAYSKYLNLNQDSLRGKRGYIIIEYYGLENTNHVLQDSIVKITKKKFNANVSLKEIENDRFTIKIYDR